MDYVVYGTGYGATLMLLGYAIRTWGPNLRFRDQDEHGYERQELQSARSAWSRFTGGLGAIIATCGAALAVLTFLLMLINPGDTIGVPIALGASGLILVAVAIWAWLYFGRFGTWGVLAMPAPLSNYEPARYASGVGDVRPFEASGDRDDTHADEDDDESFLEASVDDEEEGAGLDEHGDDFDARYSKFQLHHPDEAPTDEVSETVESTDVPSGTDVSVSDAAVDEAVDEADQSEPRTDEETDVVEPISGKSDAQLADDIETPDAESATEAVHAENAVVASAPDVHDVEEEPAVVDVVDGGDDTLRLEIVPEAHDPEPDVVEPPLEIIERAGETEQERSGREDALRRLRERRARRGNPENDDA